MQDNIEIGERIRKFRNKFKINIPYSKGEKKNYQVSLNVEYDNIP